MSLFVRVYNSFYTHRKTMRLKAVIGEAAFWVPPRIWAYAAEHQPDGCLKDFSAEEIAMLIGYLGDATSMLQALLKAGFLNPDMTIHDWAEHNGYHEKYASRASLAAKARWEKERTKEKEKTGEEKTGEERRGDKHCLEYASSMLQASDEPEKPTHAPSWPSAQGWLSDVQSNGADYTEFETRGAWLALNANGWMWGKNQVVDWRSALERRIQDDREKKEKRSGSKNDAAQRRAEKAAKEYPEVIKAKVLKYD